ncbi:non-ribosomal peptide synthetase [Clostridium cellulovorans]|uniref:Amino acid adenylation domain protein n=1 Tax=Clostridium cellulovorans (strain ATCC 35296 / DSM 3052 / OCM 3 / 743B) TaxID=573061 RepID=D9SLH3_CLOC7|nr:non-ribosomal peptide synthetase [Clostridium cellulovorans]ADL53610.1 amino acid adenylation domain protein [Clostridium cellulovorans 743B]
MKNDSIQNRISLNASKMPDKIAIQKGNELTTYGELEKKSNTIAEFLRQNLSDDKKVFLMLDKGAELIESMVGVIKAGGIFVPLDPNFPEKRQLLMINECLGDVIITSSKYLEKVCSIAKCIVSKVKVLTMDEPEDYNKYVEHISLYKFNEIEEQPSNNEILLNKNCYIYFTSGSTGIPKAILGRHRSLLHYIDWEIREFNLDDNCKVSQLTSQSFDPFLRDIFVPLVSGGTVYIPDNDAILINPEILIKWINESSISVIHMVPSLLKVVVEYVKDKNSFPSLKYIMLAGEMLRGNDVKNFINKLGNSVQLVNLYGPTETTLAKFFYRISEDDVKRDRIPVGKPIDHTEAMILNENQMKCRIGEVGEVYIRTPFITSGYLNNKELTRQVFLKNPFGNNPADIIYKTGDLGFIHNDGKLELVGRADHQVKIRGIRIELGEIENKVLACNGIKDAVAVDKADRMNNKYICCYYTAEEEISPSSLREQLIQSLPEYMVPSQFIKIEKIPMTPNGKVDRKELIKIQAVEEENSSHVPPSNELEQRLVDIWKEVLGLTQIGITDNFFNVGGNSLLLVQLHARVDTEYPNQVDIMELYKKPTIQHLARLIGNTVNNKEIELNLKFLKVPYEYLVMKNTNNIVELAEFNIESKDYENISAVCSEERIELYTFLLAMYSYTLKETFEADELCLYSNILDETSVGILNIDFGNISDFSSLFESIHGIRAIESFSKDQLMDSNYSRKVDEVAIYFGVNERKEDNYVRSKFYDLAINLVVDKELITISFSYNDGKLNSAKMEELASRFIELIQIISQQYV